MKNAEYFDAEMLRHLLNPFFKFAYNMAKSMIMPDIPLIKSLEAPEVKNIY